MLKEERRGKPGTSQPSPQRIEGGDRACQKLMQRSRKVKQIYTLPNEALLISIEGLFPYMAESLEQVTLNRPFQTPTCSRLQALGNKRKDDNSGKANSGQGESIAESKGLVIRGSEAWNAHLKRRAKRSIIHFDHHKAGASKVRPRAAERQ
jgi:hypothetical protein